MFEALPPIGVIPKKIHDEKRILEILRAMIRFIEANKPIPQDWVDELRYLLTIIILT